MAEPVRRGGHGRQADGSIVSWTVAEGVKGRRWREVVVRDGAIVHSLLLETFPDGRFAHLELSTAVGLLTLHPEGDATLHGNVVTAAGVRHVRGIAWPPDGVVLVEASPTSAAAACWLHRDAPVRGTVRAPALRIAFDLALRDVTVRLVRGARGRWTIDSAPVGVDPAGLPELSPGHAWPLEETAEPGSRSPLSSGR